MASSTGSGGATVSPPVDPKTALVSQLVLFNLPQEKLTQILLDDRPDWGWSNMYTYAGADVILHASLDARPALYNYRSITSMWLIFLPIIIASFFLASHFFRYMPWLKNRYRAIPKGERISVIFQFIFAIAFAIKIVPQTIWTIHLLYGPSFSLQFNNNYKRLWACAITNAILYTAEGCVRSIVRINYFLVFHHILYVTIFMIVMVRTSVWGQKLILILDCFIVLSELPLYLALLTHRLVVSTRKVKVVTWLCLLWSILVRLMELVVLIAYFAGTRDRMAEWGETQMWGWFLVIVILGGSVTVLFSFGFFWWYLYKRDKYPERYGPERFSQKTLPTNQSGATWEGAGNGVSSPHSVPSKLDP